MQKLELRTAGLTTTKMGHVDRVINSQSLVILNDDILLTTVCTTLCNENIRKRI